MCDALLHKVHVPFLCHLYAFQGAFELSLLRCPQPCLPLLAVYYRVLSFPSFASVALCSARSFFVDFCEP